MNTWDTVLQTIVNDKSLNMPLNLLSQKCTLIHFQLEYSSSHTQKDILSEKSSSSASCSKHSVKPDLQSAREEIAISFATDSAGTVTWGDYIEIEKVILQALTSLMTQIGPNLLHLFPFHL